MLEIIKFKKTINIPYINQQATEINVLPITAMKNIVLLSLYLFGCFLNSISAQSNSQITELEIKIQEETAILGANHLDIAMYCDSLGAIFMKAREYTKADSLFSRALEIKVENLKGNHPKIAASYYNLGIIYLYNGAYNQAKSFLNKALGIRLEVFGEKKYRCGKYV